uniref:MYND-type domain-containing protein n=1 Tax=Anopheles maculatus TaxID=74869 RepID=A0A182TAJ5_9DIPT
MEGFIGMAQAPDNMVDLFEDLWEESILPYLTPKQKRQQTFEQALEFMINKFSSILKGSHYQERLNLRPEVKSNSKAQCLRDAGNRCFYLTQQNQLAKALTLYNESIAYAEKGSEDRALAYANRASVCLQFRRYEDCLVNVRLARESNYPSRHAEKLNKREEIAKNGLAKKNTNDGTVAPDEDCATRNDRKKAVETLKLSYSAHANVPQVAECLQLRHDTTFGRHVVTNRALKAGDVVMIEKPFLSVLDSNLHYIRCAYCHDERAFTLIPCEGCTTAMYCSEQCLSNAHQQFHRYECGALRDLSQNGCETLRSLGLRATAVAITTFGHDLDALKTHLEGLDESKVNAFTMDWNTATQKDIYNTVHVLSTNQENRNRKFLARDIFQCTIMHQLMLERTELGAICQADSKKARLIFDLILRHRMICHANLLAMWGTPVMNESDNNSPPLLLGFGYFPLMSMLNHSCVPNVQNHTWNEINVSKDIFRYGIYFLLSMRSM